MRATITDIIKETTSVRRFFLKAENALEFQPGQFITLKMPNGTERSYSIASLNAVNTEFELCIVLNPTGIATPVLWQMKPGDELDFDGPLGQFVLHEPVPCDFAFICTGTGVAPFRPMIQELLKGRVRRQIFLIFGCRTQADLLYRSEFEAWQQEHSGFQYIPVLSREFWDGRKGYVHSVYEELFADGRDARFYVCGWQAMCKEARMRLKQLGYNRRQYFFEEYDG